MQTMQEFRMYAAQNGFNMHWWSESGQQKVTLLNCNLPVQDYCVTGELGKQVVTPLQSATYPNR